MRNLWVGSNLSFDTSSLRDFLYLIHVTLIYKEVVQFMVETDGSDSFCLFGGVNDRPTMVLLL